MEEFEPRVLEEFLGAVAVGEQVDRALEPLIGVALVRQDRRRGVAPVLVERMGGDAVPGDVMHFDGAHLQFHALASGPDHGRVDGAIVVLLGRRNVILEPARDHRPFRVHHADHAIAVLDLANHDAEAENVRQLLEGDGFALHLAPDRIGLLLPTAHLRLDAAPGKLLGQLVFDGLDQLPVLVAQVLEPGRDHGEGLRHHVLEREVLQLVAQVLHAHPAGQRRIDFERLLGDARALFRRHMMQGAHVVQAVRELDQQHAHVLGDGQQQLSEVFGLRGAPGDEIELLQLGQAIDKAADFRSEQLVDFRAGRARVLDRVMQHGGDDGRVVELHFGQDRRHFQRMREIGIAGGALLRAMRAHGVDIGAIEQVFVRLRIIFSNAIDEFVLPHHL